MGGSSGGGGSSGKVDYPTYMKDAHKKYLKEIEKLLPAPNPFVDVDAPSIDLLLNNTSVVEYGNYLQQRIDEVHQLPLEPNISICLRQPQFLKQVMMLVCYVISRLKEDYDLHLGDSYLAQEQRLQDFLARLENENKPNDVDFENEIRPRFVAGMRDINAVQMSSYVIGLSVMEGVQASKNWESKNLLRMQAFQLQTDFIKQMEILKVETAKVNADRIQGILTILAQLMAIGGEVSGSIDELKVKLETTLYSLFIEMSKLREASLNHLDSLVDAYTAKNVELSRMQVVASFEKSNVDIDYDEKQYRWDLENYQYLANMLAAIGSGTVTPGGRQTSKFTSALGGALSGAAAGMTFSGGNPIGAAVGGILGAGAALLG